MVLAHHMGYSVAVGDINNAYLYATTKEKVYTIGGQAFVNAGYTAHASDLGRVCRAQYGLGTSGHEWYVVLAETLRELGFKRSRGDPDVWYRPNGNEYYDYVGTVKYRNYKTS